MIYAISTFKQNTLVQIREGKTPTIFEEFDPGSGLTLAECLTHASRTDIIGSLLLIMLVANGRVTRIQSNFELRKTIEI